MPSKIALDRSDIHVPGNMPNRPSHPEEDPDAVIGGAVRRAGCVALAVLVLAAGAPVASQASIVEVRAGVLTVAQAPGEATSTHVRPVPGAAGAWQVSGVRWAFGLRSSGSDRPERWPGTPPGPGAGCASLGPPTLSNGGASLRCDGVARVALSFGDGPDHATALGGPVALAGGGGRDSLEACGATDAVLDGGPGDDDLKIFDGSASGGPGNDYLFVSSCFGPGEAPSRAETVIDCGPGDDVLFYLDIVDIDRPQQHVNARSCPPLSRALRPYGPGTPSSDRVRIPADYRLRVPLFRASEPVTGTARLVHDSGTGRRGDERAAAVRRASGPAPAGPPVSPSPSRARSYARRSREGPGSWPATCSSSPPTATASASATPPSRPCAATCSNSRAPQPGTRPDSVSHERRDQLPRAAVRAAALQRRMPGVRVSELATSASETSAYTLRPARTSGLASQRLADRGLPALPNTTPHTLRRTYISIALLANRFDVLWVMSQVGHADSKMTMDVYAQLQQRVEREHGRAFDALVRQARGRLYGADEAPNRRHWAVDWAVSPKWRARSRREPLERAGGAHGVNAENGPA